MSAPISRNKLTIFLRPNENIDIDQLNVLLKQRLPQESFYACSLSYEPSAIKLRKSIIDFGATDGDGKERFLRSLDTIKRVVRLCKSTSDTLKRTDGQEIDRNAVLMALRSLQSADEISLDCLSWHHRSFAKRYR